MEAIERMEQALLGLEASAKMLSQQSIRTIVLRDVIALRWAYDDQRRMGRSVEESASVVLEMMRLEKKVERDNIEEARRWAREALDVRNPRCVTRTEVYIQCSRCDSAPCACEKRS
jgi:hypothetical protein